MIMKKDYFKPEIVSVDMVAANFLATSGDNTIPGGSGTVIPKSSERRGEWGDVWSE